MTLLKTHIDQQHVVAQLKLAQGALDTVQGQIGTVAGFQIETAGTTITAGATQTQAGATVLTKQNSRVTTVATKGDGVRLPTAAIPGAYVSVLNAAAANGMQVYGLGTDTINGIATGTGIFQDANTTVNYACFVAGNWIAVPDASKPAQWTTGALQTAVFPAGALSGAQYVTYTNTGATPGTLTTRTATQMFADAHNAQIGQTYILEIGNSSANTMTIGAGSGVTLTGTATLLTNTTRKYAVTFTSATALAMQNIGAGLFS